jgi:hypothetical protein
MSMNCLRALVLTLLGSFSAALCQEPVRPAPKPPVTVESSPVKAPPAKQEPAKQDPAKPTPVSPKPAVEPPKVDEEPAPEVEPEPQLPPGASPEDLRAMRSAQEMLGAERRLIQRIKKGELKGIEQLLRFEEISSWPYQDGLKGAPEGVRKLDTKPVVMIGFMLPIDEVENIREFLLVQSLWACCYGTPPDINGIVRVVMKGDKRCDYQFDPVMVSGNFRVQETREDGFCIDIYQLEAEAVSLVK